MKSSRSIKKSLMALVLLLAMMTLSFVACDGGSNDSSASLEFAPVGDGYEVAGIGTYENKAVVIPSSYEGKSVVRIGNGAFRDAAITSVTIPESVTEIGDYAFEACTALTSVKLPHGLKSIGDFAFSNTAITSVTISEDIMSIGKKAFADCSSLKAVVYNATDCSPDWYDAMENNYYTVFFNCPINSVTIGSRVTVIPRGLFYDPAGAFTFTSVSLPDSVNTIENQAFMGCRRLSAITIPESLTKIGPAAFYECDALASVEFAGSSTKWKFVSVGENNDCLKEAKFDFKKEEARALSYQSYGEGYAVTGLGNIVDKAIVIPSEHDGKPVVAIAEKAFREKDITSVTIPESVKEIGDRAFENCRSLTSVTLPVGLVSIGHYAFTDTAISSIEIPATVSSMGKYAFADCERLASVTFNAVNCAPAWYVDSEKAYYAPFHSSPVSSVAFGESVEVVPNGLFYNSNTYKFTSVTLPATLKSIGNDAFNRCDALVEIKILSETLSLIGINAFRECYSLGSVEFAGSMNTWKSIDFTSGNAPLLQITPSVPKTLEYRLDGDSYTVIGVGSYEGNILAIPSTYRGLPVTSIGDQAFMGSLFQVITIPNSVTHIGNEAFKDCVRISSITIPENVKSIGANAFADCIILKNVIYNATNCSKEGYMDAANNVFLVFARSPIDNIKIGSNVTVIPAYLFAEISGKSYFTFTTLTIPEGVKTIEAGAFSECVKLRTLTLPASVKIIEPRAFELCSGLMTLNYRGSASQFSQIVIGEYNNPLTSPYTKVNYNY